MLFPHNVDTNANPRKCHRKSFFGPSERPLLWHLPHLRGHVWLSLSLTASIKSMLIGAHIPQEVKVKECSCVASRVTDDVSSCVMSIWFSFGFPASDNFCKLLADPTNLEMFQMALLVEVHNASSNAKERACAKVKLPHLAISSE